MAIQSSSPASERVYNRAKTLFGQAVVPCMLEQEVLRWHPEISDIDQVQATQLDLLLIEAFNRMLLAPTNSQRQIFEDVVLPRLPQSLPVVEKSMSRETFYNDEPQLLIKSEGMELIDKYKAKASEVAKNRATRQEVNHVAYQAVEGEEELNKLEAQLMDQIDNWTEEMDAKVKKLMNSIPLDSAGEFVSRYVEFKRALKSAIRNIKWDEQDKARNQVIKKMKKSMAAMRMVGNDYFDTTDFNHITLINIESHLGG